MLILHVIIKRTKNLYRDWMFKEELNLTNVYKHYLKLLLP